MRHAIWGILFLGSTGLAAGLPAPDPASWEPASAAGPALFIATPISVEDFRNPPNKDYACHATPADAHQGSSQQGACFSNACGLERITFKPVQVLAGTVPTRVSLNSILGEWCTSVSAPGREFLVALLPDKHWSLFEVVEVQGRSLVVPSYSGCVGDVDLKPLLAKQGIEWAAAGDKKQMAWRMNWRDEAPEGPCGEWIPQEQFQKVLPLATVVDSWKNKHP